MIGLTIAGLDPSGGAGIIEDVKTMATLGVHPTAAVTAIAAQNPKNVFSVEPVSIKSLSDQIDSILDEYDVKYTKTGLLYSKEIIKIASSKIDKYNLKNVVDPVMVASTGSQLAKEDLTNHLKKYILRKSILVTPNISEAEKLADMTIKHKEDGMEAAYKIGKYCSVIITGGHFDGVNIFYNKEKDEISYINQDLVESNNLHGTGCCFSAAVVANLIRLENNLEIADEENYEKGDELKLAIENSLKFVYESVKNGRYGTLNPNFNCEPFTI